MAALRESRIPLLLRQTPSDGWCRVVKAFRELLAVLLKVLYSVDTVWSVLLIHLECFVQQRVKQSFASEAGAAFVHQIFRKIPS